MQCKLINHHHHPKGSKPPNSKNYRQPHRPFFTQTIGDTHSYIILHILYSNTSAPSSTNVTITYVGTVTDLQISTRIRTVHKHISFVQMTAHFLLRRPCAG